MTTCRFINYILFKFTSIFKNIRKLLDISIFIDTPSKIRYKRRLEVIVREILFREISIIKTPVQGVETQQLDPLEPFDNLIIFKFIKRFLRFVQVLRKGIT